MGWTQLLKQTVERLSCNEGRVQLEWLWQIWTATSGVMNPVHHSTEVDAESFRDRLLTRVFVEYMSVDAGYQTIYDVASMIDRERADREANPSAGVVDSQSVKAPAAREHSNDAGKKINGRKRHIAIDTDGRLLMVNLTTADISDSVGAQKILKAMRRRWPWMKHLFADSAYDRKKLMDKAAFLDFTVEVVRRTDTEPGFKVVPRRWVVERTFGWMTHWRRLVRDYEARIGVSGGMIQLAMANLLLRRVCH